MQYIHSSHSVYLLTYHFVFIVKYRRKVITDEIGDAMKLYIAELCKKSMSRSSNHRLHGWCISDTPLM